MFNYIFNVFVSGYFVALTMVDLSQPPQVKPSFVVENQWDLRTQSFETWHLGLRSLSQGEREATLTPGTLPIFAS